MNKKYIFFSFKACIYMAFSGAVIGTLIWSLEHQKFPLLFRDLYLSLIVLGVFLVYAFICSWVPWGSFSPKRIKAANTLCIPKSIEWSEISHVKLRSIVGLRWLCLYTEKSRFAVWLPLNIRGVKNLQEIINSQPNKEVITNVWSPKT